MRRIFPGALCELCEKHIIKDMETYSNTDIISLESDSGFIFMVKDDTGDADEKRTLYFTDSTSNLDKDIIFHGMWYTDDK